MPNATAFDYGQIPHAEARARLRAAVQEIRQLQGSGVETLAIGQRLVEIQAIVLAGQPRGSWGRFCRGELAMSPNTATRFMRVWRVFGDLPPAIAANLQRTALTELAGEYVSAELRSAAINLAAAGQYVSLALVAELLDKHGLTRPAKRVSAVAGISNRGLHKFRSAVKQAFEQCPAADRGKLLRELQALVAELASQAAPLDDAAARARRLRTRRLPVCPASSPTAVEHQSCSMDMLAGCGVPI